MNYTITNLSDESDSVWGATEWYSTADLRLAVPDRTTTEAPVLQQLWRRDKISRHGHICGHEMEWRAVPRVVVPANELKTR